MTRAPDWKGDEFDTLLRNNSLSAERLSALLPRRSAGAIEAVRSGIHEFHRKDDSSLLSKMMKARLRAPGMAAECPVCRERVG
jgi:hypothetical protein